MRIICKTGNKTRKIGVNEKTPQVLDLRDFQRTGRDSNPRYAFDVHTISNGMSSLCNALMLSFSKNLLQFYSSFAAAVFVWAWEAFCVWGFLGAAVTCAGLVRDLSGGVCSVAEYQDEDDDDAYGGGE